MRSSARLIAPCEHPISGVVQSCGCLDDVQYFTLSSMLLLFGLANAVRLLPRDVNVNCYSLTRLLCWSGTAEAAAADVVHTSPTKKHVAVASSSSSSSLNAASSASSAHVTNSSKLVTVTT